MKIFFAGATGGLGHRVVPQLIEAGHEVAAVRRSEAVRNQPASAGARPIELDLFDAAAVNRAVAGQDVIINLATSIPPVARTFLPGSWGTTSRIRTYALANLVGAALAGGVRRYIQESFAPIYPDCGDQWIDENTPPHPAKYNRAVLDAESATRRFTQKGGMGIALRFAYLYGPDSPTTVATIRYAKRGWGLVFGAPEAYYSSVSHDDDAAWTCQPESTMSAMTSRSRGANTSTRWPICWGYHHPGSYRVGSRNIWDHWARPWRARSVYQTASSRSNPAGRPGTRA